MESGFDPRILICTECNEEFVFTVAAQEYFAERGYSEDPKRCKTCHTKFKKDQRSSSFKRGTTPEKSEYTDQP